MTMNNTLNCLAEIKTVGTDATGVFTGLASMFGNTDLHGDVIAKGAFTKSLAKLRTEGRRPAMLDHHKMDAPVGVWDSIVETEKGLEAQGTLTMGVTRAAELHALAKAGALTGLSIGFRTVDEEFKSGTRIIKEIDLWEISLVTMPANEEARIQDVKHAVNIKDKRELEHALRSELGFSANAAKSIASNGWKSADSRDVTAELLDGDLREVVPDELNRVLIALSRSIRNHNGGHHD